MQKQSQADIDLAVKHARWLLDNQIEGPDDLMKLWRVYGKWKH